MVQVVDLQGKALGEMELPLVFDCPVRADVIQRAFLALDSHSRSVQGRDPLAGERTSAETYNPPTGRGIARVPRVKGERYSKSGMAGGVASVVHGRLPFPPRSEKRIRKKINKKENRLALASAIAATADEELVARRGHLFSSRLPIIVSEDLERITKTRDLRKFLSSIGADAEVERATRNRRKKLSSRLASRWRRKAGPLLVVSDASVLAGYVRSIPGVSVRRAADLSVLDLAPGAVPGRLTIWSRKALESAPERLKRLSETYAA